MPFVVVRHLHLSLCASHKFLKYNSFCVIYASVIDTDQESNCSASTELKTKLDQQYYKSLDGFLMVIAKNGDIVYVSENIEKYLGLSQVYFWLKH